MDRQRKDLGKWYWKTSSQKTSCGAGGQVASAVDCHSKGPGFDTGPGWNFKCGCISPQARWPTQLWWVDWVSTRSKVRRRGKDRPTPWQFRRPWGLKCKGASSSHRYGRWAYACDLYLFIGHTAYMWSRPNYLELLAVGIQLLKSKNFKYKQVVYVRTKIYKRNTGKIR